MRLIAGSQKIGQVKFTPFAVRCAVLFFAALIWFLYSPPEALAVVPVKFLESQPVHCSEKDFNCNKEGKRGREKPDRDDIGERAEATKHFVKIVQLIKDWIQKGDKPTAGLSAKEEYGVGYPAKGVEYFIDRDAQLRGEDIHRVIRTLSTEAGGLASPELVKYLDTILFIDPQSIRARLNVKRKDFDFRIDYRKYYSGDADWVAYFSYTLNPRIDTHGLPLLAIDSVIEKTATVIDNLRMEFPANRGFVGVRQIVADCKIEEDRACIYRWESTVPGGTIADQLENAVRIDFERKGQTDEIEEEDRKETEIEKLEKVQNIYSF